MRYSIAVKGFKYQCFGLRQEWLYDFLKKGEPFFNDNSLGPKQIEAFIYYLRDSELIDKKKNPTHLYYIARDLYYREGGNSQTLWGIIWVNLCFNISLFTWWTTLRVGNYHREELLENLIVSYGKNNMSIKSGFSSIRETLVKSPIGELFSQGIIDRNSRITKEILKAGCSSLSPILILYNLYKLAEKEGIYRIELQDIEEIPLSPQRIFAISTQNLERSFFKSSECEPFYRLSIEDNRNYIYLSKDLSSVGILEKYIGRKRE